jgi:hypothetical protein
MANELAGTVTLWGGWSLVLPNRCLVERHRNGSWSAWDGARSIDIHIVEIGGDESGAAVAPERMLGAAGTVSGDGWVGNMGLVDEVDEDGPAHRLALDAASVNTYLSCWVAFRDLSELPWARAVTESVRHRADA